ncbi:MAG TPA: hypothetical protein VNW29_05000 [Candidatus Sulfotelmatobacter sp.]|jgi:hypothetical protein|nr:hypothetical protein [Candidatus Sulfotelmatobacter sp.]
MKNKIILESLSMDLLRVALGLHRGSYKMAERFAEEALKRKQEIHESDIKPYFKKTLSRMEISLKTSDLEKRAEDALMYSTLVRNYCQIFC